MMSEQRRFLRGIFRPNLPRLLRRIYDGTFISKAYKRLKHMVRISHFPMYICPRLLDFTMHRLAARSLKA